MIRVVIADDQREARLGIRWSLESDPEIRVVAECSNGEDAVSVSSRLGPDVVTMDVRMPGIGGLSATKEILTLTQARVLVVTTYDFDEYAFEALDNGASGFLTKDTDAVQLVAAVRSVANGDAVLTPRVTAELLRRWRPSERKPSSLGLTRREEDFVRLVGRGCTSAEIAAALQLNEGGVRVSICRLLTKLGLRDRVQVVRFAYENGLT